MVDIERNIYKSLAEQIVNVLPDCGVVNRNFELEVERESLVVKLSLSALVEKKQITPVWWQCATQIDGSEVNNCFSWSELEPFVIELLEK